eukprot:2041-Heterococcus_DN1.PRE.1
MATALSATAAASTDTTAAAAAAALEKVQRGCIDCCARLRDCELNSSTSAATTATSAATVGTIGELCVTVGIRGEWQSLCTALQQPSLQLRICLVNVLVSAAKACDPAKLQCLAELHGLLEACITAGTASVSQTDVGKTDHSEEQQQQLQAACLQTAFVLLLRGHSLYHYTERADALLLDLAVVVAAAADDSSRRSEVVRLGTLKLLSAAVAALSVDSSTTATTTSTAAAAAAAAAAVADSTLQRVAAVLLELQ